MLAAPYGRMSRITIDTIVIKNGAASSRCSIPHEASPREVPLLLNPVLTCPVVVAGSPANHMPREK